MDNPSRMSTTTVYGQDHPDIVGGRGSEVATPGDANRDQRRLVSLHAGTRLLPNDHTTGQPGQQEGDHDGGHLVTSAT